MKNSQFPETAADIECLNERTLLIDLDALEVEVLDQRLELALATLFGNDDVEVEGAGCPTNGCSGYEPSDW